MRVTRAAASPASGPPLVTMRVERFGGDRRPRHVDVGIAIEVPVAELDRVEHFLDLIFEGRNLNVGADAGDDDRHAVDLRAAAAE